MARRKYAVSLKSPYRQVWYPLLACGHELYSETPNVPITIPLAYPPSPLVTITAGFSIETWDDWYDDNGQVLFCRWTNPEAFVPAEYPELTYSINIDLFRIYPNGVIQRPFFQIRVRYIETSTPWLAQNYRDWTFAAPWESFPAPVDRTWTVFEGFTSAAGVMKFRIYS